jgi:hypothetical protein
MDMGIDKEKHLIFIPQDVFSRKGVEARGAY